jgi:hypothetical protein
MPGDSVGKCEYHRRRHHEAASNFFDQKIFRLHIQHAAIGGEHRLPDQFLLLASRFVAIVAQP